MRLRVCLLLGALVWTGPVLAEAAADAVEVTEAGRYRSSADGIADLGRSTTGLSPLIIIDDPQLVEQTDRIEARPCTLFGIRYVTPNLQDPLGVAVAVRVTHPLIVRPDGAQGTVDTWETTVGPAGQMSGFQFDEAWEMVPGRWTFAVMSGDRVLAEHGFDVVQPAAGRGAAGRCGGAVS